MSCLIIPCHSLYALLPPQGIHPVGRNEVTHPQARTRPRPSPWDVICHQCTVHLQQPGAATLQDYTQTNRERQSPSDLFIRTEVSGRGDVHRQIYMWLFGSVRACLQPTVTVEVIKRCCLSFSNKHDDTACKVHIPTISGPGYLGFGNTFAVGFDLHICVSNG